MMITRTYKLIMSLILQVYSLLVPKYVVFVDMYPTTETGKVSIYILKLIVTGYN